MTLDIGTLKIISALVHENGFFNWDIKDGISIGTLKIVQGIENGVWPMRAEVRQPHTEVDAVGLVGRQIGESLSRKNKMIY